MLKKKKLCNKYLEMQLFRPVLNAQKFLSIFIYIYLDIKIAQTSLAYRNRYTQNLPQICTHNFGTLRTYMCSGMVFLEAYTQKCNTKQFEHQIKKGFLKFPSCLDPKNPRKGPKSRNVLLGGGEEIFFQQSAKII